jgi:hypothetical protein
MVPFGRGKTSRAEKVFFSRNRVYLPWGNHERY